MSEKDEHYRVRSIFFTPCREVLDMKEARTGGNYRCVCEILNKTRLWSSKFR